MLRLYMGFSERIIKERWMSKVSANKNSNWEETSNQMFALWDDDYLQVNWQNRNIRRDMSINVRDVGYD
jgi:hypothetical protein